MIFTNNGFYNPGQAYGVLNIQGTKGPFGQSITAMDQTVVMPVAGTFDMLTVLVDSAPEIANVEFTLIGNTSSSPVQATVSTGQTTGNSGSNTFHASAGWQMCYQLSNIQDIGNFTVSIRFTPDA